MHGTHVMTRREAMVAGAASLGVAALESLAGGQPADAPWIDAHSHVWPADTDRFPLRAGRSRKDLDPPSFTDEELMAVAGPEGVGRVVLIQHSGYHLFDNSYILDVIRRHPQQFRGVAMVDDSQAEPGASMKRLLPQGVTGFRITPFLRKEQPEQWLATPGMHAMWTTAAETRQVLCCLINPQDLPGLDAMCEKHPETPVAIDHFARIGADGSIRQQDLDNLCRLARHPQVTVKVSAFYALGKKQPPYRDLVPMIQRLFEVYGRERLMWGSDSPYQLRGVNTYAASVRLVRDHLDFASPQDRQWLLRKTAERLFFGFQGNDR